MNLTKTLILTLVIWGVLRGIFWLVDNKFKHDFQALKDQTTKTQLEIDSIGGIRADIKAFDSATNLWEQVDKLNTYDVSGRNLTKLRARSLNKELVDIVADSLEREIKLTEKLLDSLSPNYSSNFRQRLAENYRYMTETKLQFLLGQRDRIQFYMKVMDVLLVLVYLISGLLMLVYVRGYLKNG